MLGMEVKVMNYLFKKKEAFCDMLRDDRGDTNVISIIIILVVVIGLAVMFKNNVGKLAGGIWNTINSDTAGFVS